MSKKPERFFEHNTVLKAGNEHIPAYLGSVDGIAKYNGSFSYVISAIQKLINHKQKREIHGESIICQNTIHKNGKMGTNADMKRCVWGHQFQICQTIILITILITGFVEYY